MEPGVPWIAVAVSPDAPPAAALAGAADDDPLVPVEATLVVVLFVVTRTSWSATMARKGAYRLAIVRALAPDVPPELEGLCLRCLAKNPEERPATAEEVAQALKACLTPG